MPLNIDAKEGVLIDKDFLNKMLRFHRRVNPKEGLVGLYFSSAVITPAVSFMFSYYQELLKDKKNKPLMPAPLLMLVDPTMQGNKMGIKVLSLVNIRPMGVFAECPFSFQVKDFERTGLDMLFFGQEHVDTMAILQKEDSVSLADIGNLMSNQKLFSNKEMMLRNLKEVIDNLTDCEQYIQGVVKGDTAGNSDLGRLLDDTMGQFSTNDMEHLEQLVAGNFEDALMINSLARLQTG